MSPGAVSSGAVSSELSTSAGALRLQGVCRQPSRAPTVSTGCLDFRRADSLCRQGPQPQEQGRFVFSSKQCFSRTVQALIAKTANMEVTITTFRDRSAAA